MTSVLFVDDEINVLEGLRRVLHRRRQDWQIAFATSGTQALAMLAEHQFDVVVSDMRMPGMDGAKLLTEINRQHPACVRIILSGYSDQEMALKAVGTAHRYLTKPCEIETLIATIARISDGHHGSFHLRGNDALRQTISSVRCLPSLPSLYEALVAELRAPHPSIERVGRIIARDVGMAAKILQLANSSFFGTGRSISAPAEAAKVLGPETIAALVSSTDVFSACDEALLLEFSLHKLALHSSSVGATAREIAISERQRFVAAPADDADDAYTAGLLHDAGRLLWATHLPQQYRQAFALSQTEVVSLAEAEKVVFGATQAQVGAHLCNLWGLPAPIVEAVAMHRSFSADEKETGDHQEKTPAALAALRLAHTLLTHDDA